MRRVEPDGWRAYKDVRLKALRTDPSAFSSTLDGELRMTEEQWRKRVSRSATFVATAGGAAVGLAAGIDGEEAGSAELVSMWVDPGRRREGVGTRLISAVADWAAASGFKTLALWVVEGNQAAEDAYVRSGFSRTGRRQAVRFEEPDMEFEMARAL